MQIKDGEKMDKENNEIDENTHQYTTIKAKPVILKDNYHFFKHHFLYHIISFILRFITIFLTNIYMYIWLGYRIKNRKNYHKVKGGCIMVANHIMPMDGFIIPSTFFPKMTYVLSLQSNLGLPLFGKFITLIGAVPIPEKRNQLKRFSEELVWKANKGGRILIYPEAALIPFCDHIRPFKKGAFRYALLSEKPIIPLVWTFHKPKSPLKRLLRKNPCPHLNVLDPYYPTTQETSFKTLDKTMTEVHNIMEEYFNTHSEFTSLKQDE